MEATTTMEETEGRNPRPSPNLVAQAQHQSPLLDRSSMEDACDKRPLLPPNYVSLRQLRDMRLKEREEQEREKEEVKVKQSTDLGGVPLESVSSKLQQERHLKEEKQKEEDEEIEKGNVKEESESCCHLPPNLVSLRQLKEQQVRKEQEREKEEGNVKEKDGVKAQEEEREKVKERNFPNLPPNYISLKHLKELREKEKEQMEAEKALQKSKLPQAKVGEEGEETGLIKVEINKKAPNMARNLQSKKSDKHDFAESNWVWKPVSPPGGTGSNTVTLSAGAVVLTQNDGVSHEVVMTVSHQTEDAGMKPKNQWKKKKQSRKSISGKDNDKLAKGPVEPIEVAGVEIGKALNTSSKSTEAVILSKNENNTVTKGNEENVNVTESSSKSIIADMEVKRFNKAQSSRFKRHGGGSKGKGREVNLSEQSHTVVSLSKVMKGSNGVEEVIGSKIEKGKEQKGKGNEEVTLSQHANNTVKKVNEENVNLTESSMKSITASVEVKRFNGAQSSQFKRHNGRGKGKGEEQNGTHVPELCDKMPSNEEQNRTHGANEFIWSKIQIDKGHRRGKNINLPELSKGGDRGGDNRRKWNPVAWSRDRGHQSAETLPGRSAEHLGGKGGLVWVPKKSS